MKNKLALTLLFFLLSTCFVLAQIESSTLVRDTIFVYDTLYITDTIHIERPSIELVRLDSKPIEEIYSESLNKDFKIGEKVIIFLDGTATIYDSNIIHTDKLINSKKSEEMKKLSFLSLMFFAFQNMVLAQNDIGLSIGGGLHNLVVDYSGQNEFANVFMVTDTKLEACFNAGLNIRRPIVKNKLQLNAGLNYYYLSPTSFPVTIQNGEPVEVNTIDSLAIERPYIPNFLNQDENFTTAFHLISLPIGVYANTKWVRPGVGVELYHKRAKVASNITYTDQDGNIVAQNQKHIIPYTGVSVFGGLQIPIAKRFDIEMKYTLGLTSEYIANYNDVEIKTQLQRIELAARYQLGKKNKEK